MSADFLHTYRGLLHGVLSWEQLDALWQKIDLSGPWYLYAVGEKVPESPANAEETSLFVREIDALLRRDHHEDYCGIVYVDDPSAPSLVKIFDPNHLGSSCGSSGKTVAPGWIMSRMPPAPIASDAPIMGVRRRWWQSLFSG